MLGLDQDQGSVHPHVIVRIRLRQRIHRVQKIGEVELHLPFVPDDYGELANIHDTGVALLPVARMELGLPMAEATLVSPHRQGVSRCVPKIIMRVVAHDAPEIVQRPIVKSKLKIISIASIEAAKGLRCDDTELVIGRCESATARRQQLR